jgi:glycosyltransferase involved in cell wall biosynthesis
MKPTVSVGMPVFNGERYLGRAIESILSQTFQDFELVIGDNASTDATEAICRGYASADRRIRYVRHARNLGVARNFNAVYHLSIGRYFRWAASDDLAEPRLIERCAAVLEQDSTVALAYGKTRLIDEHGALVSDY